MEWFINLCFLFIGGSEDMMNLHHFEAKDEWYGHHEIVARAAGTSILVVALLSIDRIQRKNDIQNQQGRHDKNGQIAQFVLTVVKVVEEGIAQKDGIHEYHSHVCDFYPFVQLVFNIIAYHVEHVVDRFHK